MKTKTLALLLAVIMAIMTATSLGSAFTADAATSAEVQYFLDTVGPMCTNDMRDNHILASISVAQAIWESGWGTSTLAKQANNLFGIKAYNTWNGMIFDRTDCTLYTGWDAVKAVRTADYIKANKENFWRAYPSWQESVNDHSALFNRSDNYANIRGNYDYKSVAKLLVEDGYCGEPIYTDVLISLIEQHGLEKYNYDFGGSGGTTTPTPVGNVSLSPKTLYMEKGASYTLGITAGGASYTLTSSNTAVAAVSGSTLKAVSDGTATVTLSAGGKSATCSVTVKSGYGCIVADSVYVKCLASGTTASIPTEAKTVKSGAFNGTSVSTVIVGNNVSSIESGAFNGTSGLTLYGSNNTVRDYASKNAISYVNLAGWSIDAYSSILSGIDVYTTAAVVNTYYSLSGVNATIKNAAGQAVSSNAYIGTGYTVTVSGKTYTVTVKGDTNGDGKTSSADLVTLEAYLEGNDKSLPSSAYRRAADFNSDNRITTADYLAITKES